jgi:hypothetical protein
MEEWGPSEVPQAAADPSEAIANCEVAIKGADAAITIAAASSSSPVAAVTSVLEAVAAACNGNDAAIVAAETANLELKRATSVDPGLLGASEEEIWDLTESISKEKQRHPDARVCDTETCPMPSCARWSTRGSKPEVWHTCEACQEADFGGWPSGFNSESARPDPPVPPAPLDAGNKLLECPYERGDVLKPAAAAFLPAAPPSPDSSVEAAPAPPPKPLVKSSKTSGMEKKWLADAQKFNPNAKIITSVSAAKTLIWHKLRSLSAPRTLTLLYSDFLSTIPSVLLKKALTTMVDAGRKCPNKEGLKIRRGSHADGRNDLYWT